MPPDSLYAALQRRARQRDFSPLPGYKNVRDFISSEEAAARLWHLATAHSLERRVFHVCSGKPRSVRELAIEVMKQSGIDPVSLAPMFPDNNDAPNFLISRPTPVSWTDE
jgi:nucleoside-diphosphate-sugar epimerase